MPTGRQMAAALAIVVGVPAAGIALVGFGVGHVVSDVSQSSTSVSVKVSDARLQLLDSNLAGSRSDLDKFLTAQVNEYFKGKGLNCDPDSASKVVGDTLRKAQCAKPAP